MSRLASAAAVVVAAGALLGVGCGGGTEQAPAGLSRAEVETIVSEQLALAPAPAQSVPGLTSGDVQEAIDAAVADLPEPGPSLAEIEQMVRSAVEALVEPPGTGTGGGDDVGDEMSAPSKSDPAAYTRLVVDQAIARYEAEGLEAALAHYNSPASIDDQWYVFIIDENDTVIGHFDADRRGLDVKGWVGTDINGYNFGP
ncbi:MAG: hypothetical protein OXI83_11770, partial [Gemmatimonadota bacterium]|nr:hypothetical protein [Gemmatimonadota bacterium]